MQTMMNFIEKLKTDKELLSKVSEFKKADDREGILNVMRENGVTEEDIKKGLEFEKSFESAEKDELNDDELEIVAGGKSCVTDVKPGKGEACVFFHSDSSGKLCGFVNLDTVGDGVYQCAIGHIVK